MNRNSKINMDMSTKDAIIALAEGNPGAITVLAQMVQDPRGAAAILHLDNLEIYGSKIWVGYKDHCKEDITTFINKVIARDEGLLETIRNE